MEENTQYKRYERLENTNLDSGWIRELAEALNEKQELEKRIGYLETLTKYLYVLRRIGTRDGEERISNARA